MVCLLLALAMLAGTEHQDQDINFPAMSGVGTYGNYYYYYYEFNLIVVNSIGKLIKI